ncbi:glycosyltransferase family 2 protein [Actinomycetes bacterium KLBMP 9797]
MAAAAKAPTLSIGMPVYNGAKYLEYTLERLRRQDFDGDVEVLVSDNASTDATPEIIKDFAAGDPRIRYVRQDVNLGPADNFNYVFQHTTGEYFTWLASDDLFEPHFHQRMVDLLRGRPDAAAAMSRLRLVDEHNELMDHADEPISGDHPDPVERFIRFAGFNHYCQYSYSVVRRTAMAKTRLLLPFWSSDRLWCAELALAGSLLRDPDTLFFVRQHRDRLTRRMGRRDRVTTSFYLTPSGSRAVTLYYAKQLRESLERADLSTADKTRGRRALRGWAVRNSTRLVRSAGRATLETVTKPFSR